MKGGIKRSPLKPWRRPKSDQVTPELVDYLRERDGYRCMALVLETELFESQGYIVDIGQCRGRLTVEHVRDKLPTPQSGRRGLRAPSDGAHTLLVCEGHIEWTKTARAKDLEREYLIGKEGAGK